MRDRVRLQDVALRVGVSSSEVSRVLNGRTRRGKSVAHETRERILKAARDMNYRPDRAAQNLATGRTGIVGLMTVVGPDATSREHRMASIFSAAPGELAPHSHEIIGSLAYTLSEFGLHLMLVQCGGATDPYTDMVHMARSRSFDGLVITDMLVGDPRPSLLAETGIPFVVRGSSPVPDCAAVGADNIEIGRVAIRHLYGLGHRRILFFNLSQTFVSGRRRYEGALQAARDLGILDTVEFRFDEHHADTITRCVAERVNHGTFPTAVFAEDEFAALSVERALSAAGLRVPDDVSLLTCQNARFMHMIAPHLSVIDVRQHDIAAQAARTMAAMLSGAEYDRSQQLVKPILRSYDTTAPCGSAPRAPD